MSKMADEANVRGEAAMARRGASVREWYNPVQTRRNAPRRNGVGYAVRWHGKGV